MEMNACFVVFHTHSKPNTCNKTKSRMGRINLDCGQRCYDKAHVWSPRLTCLGKSDPIKSVDSFKTIDYQTLMLFHHGLCSLTWSFATNWSNTHGPPPLPPPGTTCGEWSINDRRLTWDPPTLAKYVFFGMTYHKESWHACIHNNGTVYIYYISYIDIWYIICILYWYIYSTTYLVCNIHQHCQNYQPFQTMNKLVKTKRLGFPPSRLKGWTCSPTRIMAPAGDACATDW